MTDKYVSLLFDPKTDRNPNAWFKRTRARSDQQSPLADQAAAYVRQKIGQSGLTSTQSSLIAIRRAATTVTKASRAQHHEAVALAYAIYLAQKDVPDFKELIAGLAKTAGLRVTKATDPLAIIVGSLITYGGSSDAAASRKLRSRDVQAIRYLVRKNVSPGMVVREAARSGEGLDAWARRSEARVNSTLARTPLKPRGGMRTRCEWQNSDLGRIAVETSRPLSPAAKILIRQAFRIVSSATRSRAF